MYFLGIQTMMILATKTGIVKSKEFKLTHPNISDIYPGPILKNTVFEDPIFASDDIDVPGYDKPTKVNLLGTGTMYDYWSDDRDVLTVNAIKFDKNDPTAIRGQFDSGAGVTVTNLLIYLHNYKHYNAKFKYPVKLTGAVDTK